MHKKKLVVLSVLIAFVLLGAATSLRQKKERNLKVLPKDISDHMLDSIMQTYNKALGVTCDFCHSVAKAPLQVPTADSLDYALVSISLLCNCSEFNLVKNWFYWLQLFQGFSC